MKPFNYIQPGRLKEALEHMHLEPKSHVLADKYDDLVQSFTVKEGILKSFAIYQSGLKL